MIPGEYLLAAEPIELNAGRATARIEVSNRGDRPVQVGSHCHFFEVNRWLAFDRAACSPRACEELAEQVFQTVVTTTRDALTGLPASTTRPMPDLRKVLR